MSRRRRGKTAPPKPFEGAWYNIDKLEHAVMHATVVSNLTVLDVCRALWPPDMIDPLMAAFHRIRDVDRTDWRECVPIVLHGLAAPIKCNFILTTSLAGVLHPRHGYANVTSLQADPVVSLVAEAHHVHLQFEKVRRVVRWLNDNATVGAARHYCPWLGSVLPVDHPFQEVDGVIFREPSKPMNEIVPVMRECTAIVAAALMARMDHDARTKLTVTFEGGRDGMTYRSQQFGLL